MKYEMDKIWSSLKKTAAVLGVFTLMTGICGATLSQTEAADRKDGRPPIVENKKKPDAPKKIKERKPAPPKKAKKPAPPKKAKKPAPPKKKIKKDDVRRNAPPDAQRTRTQGPHINFEK
jgi:type IV secretory pathway VirB10-like protein